MFGLPNLWPLIHGAGGIGGSGGGSGTTAQVKAASYFTNVYEPTSTTCSITFDNTGDFDTVAPLSTPSGAAYLDYFWLLTGAPADCEIKFTEVIGTLDVGTAATWLPLTSNQTFGVTKSGGSVGEKSCSGTIEIRAGGITIASASVTLSATVSEIPSGGGGDPPYGGGGGHEY